MTDCGYLMTVFILWDGGGGGELLTKDLEKQLQKKEDKQLVVEAHIRMAIV